MKSFVSNKQLLRQRNIGDILLASEENFTTFVADNVDHNIATLDGRGTFHGMGVMAAMTNKNGTCQEEQLRSRVKKYVKVCYVCSYLYIPFGK